MHAFTSAAAGVVVDAGPKLGYGHAARCLRLVREIGSSIAVTFLPLSETCAKYLLSHAPDADIRRPDESVRSFPKLVVTDLREGGSVTAAIRASGSRHISIHDLGLAQCRSDAAIDGSVVRVFPYAPDVSRALYLGPSYAMTRPPVERRPEERSVFMTLGGGLSATFGPELRKALEPLGVKIKTTTGLGSAVSATPDEEISEAMSSCAVAVSTAGTSLYDLAASGVPTVVVSVDWLQLRAAQEFQERGAAISAGLIDRFSPALLAQHVRTLLEDRSKAAGLGAAAKSLVDGRGLSRVAAVVRNMAAAGMETLGGRVRLNRNR